MYVTWFPIIVIAIIITTTILFQKFTQTLIMVKLNCDNHYLKK